MQDLQNTDENRTISVLRRWQNAVKILFLEIIM